MELDLFREFISHPWQARVYKFSDLMELFRLSSSFSKRVIIDCNGDFSYYKHGLDWVSHHDLIHYLRDLVTPAETLESLEELSTHGKWLLSQGWLMDKDRTYYRWISPNDPLSHYTLRVAVKEQLHVLYDTLPTAMIILETDFVSRPL
jgi:hypothetical protein